MAADAVWLTCGHVQGIAFAGPALCMAICSLLTPAGARNTGSPPGWEVTVVVAVLSVAFALSSWARAGLYCNHQVATPRLPLLPLYV